MPAPALIEGAYICLNQINRTGQRRIVSVGGNRYEEGIPIVPADLKKGVIRTY